MEPKARLSLKRHGHGHSLLSKNMRLFPFIIFARECVSLAEEEPKGVKSLLKPPRGSTIRKIRRML